MEKLTYKDLMEKALGGKSVNARAKELGIPQRTLANYVAGERLPGCDAAIILANAAGVTIEDAVLTIAAKQAELRPERVHSFLRPAMASVLAGIVAVNMFLTPSPAQAASAKALSSSEVSSTLYYVKSRL